MTGLHARFAGLDIGDGHPVRVMGVLNASNESFYKASVVSPGTIVNRARDMIEHGARMLDVGGRSTWPLAPPVSIQQESQRVEAAVSALLPGITDIPVPISVDTQFPAVASTALRVFEHHGMERLLVINDVSGLHVDPGMTKWLADTGTPVILMASRGKPGDVLGIVNTIAALQDSIDMLERAGFPLREHVLIDPAIGKWIPEKVPAYDAGLVRSLADFRVLGYPVLVAISRKSFIGDFLGGRDPADRLHGTLAATAIAVHNGAHVVRTHDVNAATTDVIAVATAIRDAATPVR